MNDDLHRKLDMLRDTGAITIRGVYDEGTLAYRLLIGKAFVGTLPVWGPCSTTGAECAATITEAGPGEQLGMVAFTATCPNCGRECRATVGLMTEG